MNFDIYELGAKALIGEELTVDEKKTLHDYNMKYKLVRHLVMEKQRHNGVDLKDFQFTPGDEFMKLPAIDVANSVIKQVMNIVPIEFGDGNPPHTSKVKRALLD